MNDETLSEYIAANFYVNDRVVDGVRALESALTEARKQDPRMPELERALDDAEVRSERWAHRCREAERVNAVLKDALGEIHGMCLDKTIETHPDEHTKGTLDDCIETAEKALKEGCPQ
jgi:hypothetical protein